MSLYKEQGYRRLAVLIAIIAFIVTYTALCMNEYRVQPEEAFIGFPIVSVLTAGGAFILTRIIYWVIDGFKSKDLE